MMQEEIYSAVRKVIQKPGYEQVLKTLLEVEKQNDGRGPMWEGWVERSPTGAGWRIAEAGVPAQKVGHLRTTGIVTCFHQTARTKIYCLSDPEAIRRALDPANRKQELAEIMLDVPDEQTQCGICGSTDHTWLKCPKQKGVPRKEFQWDIVRQVARKVFDLQADVDFLRRENELLTLENIRLWAWIRPLTEQEDAEESVRHLGMDQPLEEESG